MGDKYTDKIPTIGTKNIGKQKFQEVEFAKEINPSVNNNKTSKNFNKKDPKPGGS